MKKKVIGIIIAILIIIAATLGILYYTTDLFKSPEQLFYKHFSSNAEVLEKTKYKNYEEFIKQLKEEMDSQLEIAGEITVKVTSEDTSYKEVSEVLEKSKITYNQKHNGAEKKSQSDITLNYDNKDIVTVNVLKNNEQYGIKINDLYDKYISVENNNLKDLFGKLGMDTTEIPDKIEVLDYYELLNVDKETITHIEKTYTDVIKQNIPEECYSVEKNVKVSIDSTEINTNAYKLALTETQLNNVVIKFLETLKTDDVTLDLIVNKYNQIAATNQYTVVNEKLTKEDMIKAIEDSLKDLKDEEINDNEVLEIIVYGNKDNRARIDIIGKEDGVNIANVEINMVNTENEEKVTCLFAAEDEKSIEFEMKLYDETKIDCLVKTSINDIDMEILVKQEVKATENVVIEDFTSDNAVKLNDMSSEEIGDLIQKIYNNALVAVPQKMQLLGVNVNNI